jgi:hypothetical protein
MSHSLADGRTVVSFFETDNNTIVLEYSEGHVEVSLPFTIKEITSLANGLEYQIDGRVSR